MSELYPTSFCWNCGRPIAEGLLFCPAPKKCERQYEMKQERGIKKGKRAGYGLSGSCH